MAVRRLSPLDPQHMEECSEGSYVRFADYEKVAATLEKVAKTSCLGGHRAHYQCNDFPDFDDGLWCLTCKARKTLAEVRGS